MKLEYAKKSGCRVYRVLTMCVYALPIFSSNSTTPMANAHTSSL